ncbi:MAG TPA: hypothetical protein DEB39_10670 [Planctomycetaceae bacterium]|nr:hypothetical protein [Planctomycetaceae bacterium]
MSNDLANQTVERTPGAGMGITSLVLGILSWLLCGPFTAVPGVICGYLALKTEGRGLGIAGIIISAINLIIALIVVIFISMFGLAIIGIGSNAAQEMHRIQMEQQNMPGINLPSDVDVPSFNSGDE